MKLALTTILLATCTLAGCAFDASSRPIQPAPAVVMADSTQAYCCGSCEVADEQSQCDRCQRSGAESCPVNSTRLVCVSNRVEEPESQASYRVTCY